jgi:hypothetical protein
MKNICLLDGLRVNRGYLGLGEKFRGCPELEWLSVTHGKRLVDILEKFDIVDFM